MKFWIAILSIVSVTAVAQNRRQPEQFLTRKVLACSAFGGFGNGGWTTPGQATHDIAADVTYHVPSKQFVMVVTKGDMFGGAGGWGGDPTSQPNPSPYTVVSQEAVRFNRGKQWNDTSSFVGQKARLTFKLDNPASGSGVIEVAGRGRFPVTCTVAQ